MLEFIDVLSTKIVSSEMIVAPVNTEEESRDMNLMKHLIDKEQSKR
jgi:hypothetical protein